MDVEPVWWPCRPLTLCLYCCGTDCGHFWWGWPEPLAGKAMWLCPGSRLFCPQGRCSSPRPVRRAVPVRAGPGWSASPMRAPSIQLCDLSSVASASSLSSWVAAVCPGLVCLPLLSAPPAAAACADVDDAVAACPGDGCSWGQVRPALQRLMVSRCGAALAWKMWRSRFLSHVSQRSRCSSSVGKRRKVAIWSLHSCGHSCSVSILGVCCEAACGGVVAVSLAARCGLAGWLVLRCTFLCFGAATGDPFPLSWFSSCSTFLFPTIGFLSWSMSCDLARLLCIGSCGCMDCCAGTGACSWHAPSSRHAICGTGAVLGLSSLPSGCHCSNGSIGAWRAGPPWHAGICRKLRACVHVGGCNCMLMVCGIHGQVGGGIGMGLSTYTGTGMYCGRSM